MHARGKPLAAALSAGLLFALEAWWVLSRGAIGFDLAIRDVVHAWASVPLTRAMQAVTTMGSHLVLVPLGVVLLWRFLATGRTRQAVLFAAGCLSAEIAVNLLKLGFHRPRPPVFFGQLPAETYSFPSGHSFLSTVFYGLGAGLLLTSERSPRTRRILVAAAMLAAASIGFSRVYLGYHYPSDVLGGWTCGAFWLALGAVAWKSQPARTSAR